MASEPQHSASPDGASLEGPVRTCIGCRQRATAAELLRVTSGSDAYGQPAVVPDPSGAAHGRGAHLHPTTACFELAVRRKAFPRALRVQGGGQGLSTTLLAEHLEQQPQHHR